MAQTEFETERSKGAYMDIEVSAMWDKEKNNITVTPNVTFRLNREEAPYGFAYVLTEDGMSSHNWKQANYYNGRTEFYGISDELDYFVNAPGTIYNLENNFVAIAADGVMSARTGHLKSPIKADETQSHTYVFKNINSKKVIQKKENLRVCVLLINTQTGHVENAAKCVISDPKATAISSVSDGTRSEVVVGRYTLDGRRITTPQRGINIVRYSDGRVSKEVVTK